MADVDNKWSLFGLDLTRSGKWLALGVHQLMYDQGAWLLQRFDPAIRVAHSGEDLCYRAHAVVSEPAAADQQTPFCAAALSADAVLLKTLHFPASAEEDLDDAMPIEVGLSSPFADADTRAAWRVVGRHENVIEVALAITSEAAIDDLLAEHRESSVESEFLPEVWAFDHRGKPVSFAGYGGGERRSAYLRRLLHASGLIAAAWVSFMVAVTVLAGATALRAPNYQYWLNHIAASAPETVYFDRLNFSGEEVTVSGYSNNASVYLRMLTEEPGYTDVTALSAFARDRNNGLERFSIQWRVTAPPEPTQLSEVEGKATVVANEVEAGS